MRGVRDEEGDALKNSGMRVRPAGAVLTLDEAEVGGCWAGKGWRGGDDVRAEGA